MFLPPSLRAELSHWIESSKLSPRDWLFQTEHGRPGFLNANNYVKRTLKPAAVKAGIGLTTVKDKNGEPVVKTNVDFRVLRRTCATLFGDRAKDPKSTQAQLRHADPTITLRHYQKSVPASVQAAAIALEADLGFRPVFRGASQ